jgi:hypothetical protein
VSLALVDYSTSVGCGRCYAWPYALKSTIKARLVFFVDRISSLGEGQPPLHVCILCNFPLAQIEALSGLGRR